MKERKINQILGEISGYFMRCEGKCSEVIMPTEFLLKKSKELLELTI